MRRIKKLAAIACTLTIGATMCAGFTACFDNDEVDSGVYKGVTSTTIYVGNTAGTTGALAGIGLPFNYGIEAAFNEYNQNGGFSGKYNGEEVSGLKVALKHYDDGGVGSSSATYTERLIEEDEVFAIVGNYGSYAVTANLDIIKDAKVPMIYAAAGNEEMSNEAATEAERYIFPVQPINSTDGNALILRAFLPYQDGGLGGTKVGVISNTGDASIAILKGIKAEAENLKAEQKANIVYQNVNDTSTGYATAAAALKNANCDVIIVALTTDYTTTISALIDAGFTSENVKVLTSYNNSASTNFDDNSTGKFNASYTSLINSIYTQGWIDITSTDYVNDVYKTPGDLWDEYKNLVKGTAYEGLHDYGVFGFTTEYWNVAQVLYDYGKDNSSAVPADYTPYTLSYNAYALAGYIAGNLFCQGLQAMEESELELTRTNFVDAMESKDYHVAMSIDISYADGKRFGVDTFTMNQLSAPYGVYAATSSTIVEHVASIGDLRAKNNG